MLLKRATGKRVTPRVRSFTRSPTSHRYRRHVNLADSSPTIECRSSNTDTPHNTRSNTFVRARMFSDSPNNHDMRHQERNVRRVRIASLFSSIAPRRVPLFKVDISLFSPRSRTTYLLRKLRRRCRHTTWFLDSSQISTFNQSRLSQLQPKLCTRHTVASYSLFLDLSMLFH